MIIMLSSCAGKKVISEEKESIKVEKTSSSTKDTASKVEVSKKIDNEYTIPLRTSDSLVNLRIREALKNYSAGTKSGGNSFSIKFDEESLMLKIQAIVDESKKEELVVISDSKETEAIEVVSEKNVKKVLKIIPWWIYAIVVWMLRKQIFSTISTFYPPLKLLNIYKRIMN